MSVPEVLLKPIDYQLFNFCSVIADNRAYLYLYDQDTNKLWKFENKEIPLICEIIKTTSGNGFGKRFELRIDSKIRIIYFTTPNARLWWSYNSYSDMLNLFNSAIPIDVKQRIIWIESGKTVNETFSSTVKNDSTPILLHRIVHKIRRSPNVQLIR